MDINNMTYGELKAIAALFAGLNLSPTLNPNQSPNPTPNPDQHPYVGKYVIARAYAAGVHAGTVESVNGEVVMLRNSRRLWAWKAKGGIALSGVAQFGLDKGSNLDALNPTIYLTGVCELIPTAPGVGDAITSYQSSAR